MNGSLGERLPTRATLLELRDERLIMEEGYRFLDEKRLLLAAQILRRLGEFETAQARLREAQADAAAALRLALVRHGLDGLQTYPAAPLKRFELNLHRFNLLGVPLLSEAHEIEAGLAGPRAEHASPEAEHAANAFRALLPLATEMAVAAGNLQRLMAEYRKSERRARALEDVLIPETDDAIRTLSDQLDDLDQEEAVRARRPTRHHAG